MNEYILKLADQIMEEMRSEGCYIEYDEAIELAYLVAFEEHATHPGRWDVKH